LKSLSVLSRILRVIWIYFLRPSKSFAKHKGNWAVVTGASWGIGYGFSLSLAKRGMNIALLARSGERLKEVALEIENTYKVKTKVVVVDFESRDLSIYKAVEEELKDLKITLLVNNVGINTSYPKLFEETSLEEIDNITHININAANHMTNLLLPQMKERKFGTIINVSSASAHVKQPTPLFAVYSGTKAYNQKFSMSLAEEVKKDGIEVLAVTPYFVTSKMSRSRKGSLMICTEKTHAEEALNKLGYNMQTVIPWFNHYLQYVLTANLPYVAQLGNKTVYGFRKRAIQREAEKEKEKASAQKKTE